MAAVIFLLLTLCYNVQTSGSTPSDCSFETEDYLTCHLSSINSRHERTDFSVIPNETVGLKVICNQPSPGMLQMGAFSSLKMLEELVIEGCVLKDLPSGTFYGLENLKRLEIHTGNEVSLIVQNGAFDHLDKLEALDLSQNRIRNIPTGELCKMEKLQTLNLSRNEIGSLLDIGVVEEKCGDDLTLVDLGHNHLTAIEEGSGPLSWKTIQELRIENNYIRFINENVFSNSSLKVLKLSNNQISHLPSNFIQSVALRELHLANNTLSSLSWDVFEGQYDLEILDLSGNILMSSGLPANLTQDLPNLLELNLCSNQLGDLSSQLTAPLLNLQLLKLCDNQLSSLNLSARMINLVNVDVSNNFIKKIDSNDFAGQDALTHLSVARNEITEIDVDAFRNLSRLLVLDLSDNKLFSLPAGVKYLTGLQTLDMSNNFISDISKESLDAMSSLWRLQMHGNLLLNISRQIFSSLRSLQILDLSSNRISMVESGAFAENSGLRAVRLDGNQMRDIDGVFLDIPELIWLNVSDNKIQHFDYSQFPRSLGWLDISHNEISIINNYFDIKNSAISYLDLSFNHLVQIEAKSFLENVETLLLNDNKITTIAPYTFYHQSKLAKVDLSVNEISSFSENAIRLSNGAAAGSQEPIFNLGGNPISCDCNMQWFKTINEKTKMKAYPHIVDIESIYCQLMDTEVKTFIPLVEARNDQFLCPYQTHCFSLCQCCQFDSCDCEMICPDGCSCFHDNSWSKNIIQCSNNDYHNLPTNMPMDATEIYLDGNDLPTLKSHSLIGRKNLRVLYLNNSNIERIENKTFNGLKSLRALHLENNRLTSLQGFEFNGLTHLRELYLQGNLLTSINNATFKALKSLEVLSLEGNSIIDFPIWQLAINPYLVSIQISNNLWSCDCEFLNRFTTWMKVFSTRIMDVDQISCVSNDLVEQNTRLIDYEQKICEGPIIAVAKTQVQEKLIGNYLPLMIAVLASVAMLIIFGIIIFTFRHSIKIWVQSKADHDRVLDSRQDSPNPSTVYEEPEMFDAFVSYSPLDAAFVHQILGKELESSQQYRVCLQHRDLPSPSQPDQVRKVMQSSRKTIIVLSNNYLRTQWVNSDYKAGMYHALTEEKNQKLIFVLLGGQDAALADPTMVSMLNSSIILQWGESQFWTKLRYSLPVVCSQRLESHYYSTCKFPPGFSEKDANMISHI